MKLIASHIAIAWGCDSDHGPAYLVVFTDCVNILIAKGVFGQCVFSLDFQVPLMHASIQPLIELVDYICMQITMNCHSAWALVKSHDMLDSFVLIPLFYFRGRPRHTLNDSALAGPAFFLFLPHANLSQDSLPIDTYWKRPSLEPQFAHRYRYEWLLLCYLINWCWLNRKSSRDLYAMKQSWMAIYIYSWSLSIIPSNNLWVSIHRTEKAHDPDNI